MHLDEVIRRNRRRIAVITVAAAANHWTVITMLTWLLFAVALEVEPLAAFVTAAVVGALFAGGAVVRQVKWVRPRTMAQLGAIELAPGDLPVVDNILASLALAIGMDPVRAALLGDDAPNALTVGRSPSETTIVITTGLVEELTRDQLEAVLATELWAVRRYDTAMQSATVACTGRTISAHRRFRIEWTDPRAWILIAATWPMMVVAELLRRWVLHHCDFGADAMAAATTRNPEALAQAIQRLRDDPRVVRTLEPGTAPLWFEPIPHIEGRRARELRRLRLTPTLDERLARLPHNTKPTRARDQSSTDP